MFKISTKRVLPYLEKINLLPGGLKNILDRLVSNQKPGETKHIFFRKIPEICQKCVQIRSIFLKPQYDDRFVFCIPGLAGKMPSHNNLAL